MLITEEKGMGRTIFFASWGLVWRGGGVEVVGGFVFDIGGSCRSDFGSGFGFWIEREEGDEDILIGN